MSLANLFSLLASRIVGQTLSESHSPSVKCVGWEPLLYWTGIMIVLHLPGVSKSVRGKHFITESQRGSRSPPVNSLYHRNMAAFFFWGHNTGTFKQWAVWERPHRLFGVEQEPADWERAHHSAVKISWSGLHGLISEVTNQTWVMTSELFM